MKPITGPEIPLLAAQCQHPHMRRGLRHRRRAVIAGFGPDDGWRVIRCISALFGNAIGMSFTIDGRRAPKLFECFSLIMPAAG